ncbi:MAG TPA: hypothetical protein DCZ43_04825 [candidate division Zixibacteria bacterium]|nr:hypothetical protein [candidate division Zixibacteria bacterium]
MKIRCTLLAVALLFCFAAATFAEDMPYTPGSVWNLTFVKTKGAGGDDYIKNLAQNWKKVQDEAIKQGLVISYKVLTGDAANRDDWDMLLMVEFKNYAVMDTPEQKWEEIMTKVIGNDTSQKQGNISREEMREILGGKTMREIILK